MIFFFPSHTVSPPCLPSPVSEGPSLWISSWASSPPPDLSASLISRGLTLQAEAGRVELELSMTRLRAEEASLQDSLSKLSALNESLAQDKLDLNRLVAQVCCAPAGPPALPTHPPHSVRHPGPGPAPVLAPASLSVSGSLSVSVHLSSLGIKAQKLHGPSSSLPPQCPAHPRALSLIAWEPPLGYCGWWVGGWRRPGPGRDALPTRPHFYPGHSWRKKSAPCRAGSGRRSRRPQWHGKSRSGWRCCSWSRRWRGRTWRAPYERRSRPRRHWSSSSARCIMSAAGCRSS